MRLSSTMRAALVSGVSAALMGILASSLFMDGHRLAALLTVAAYYVVAGLWGWWYQSYRAIRRRHGASMRWRCIEQCGAAYRIHRAGTWHCGDCRRWHPHPPESRTGHDSLQASQR